MLKLTWGSLFLERASRLEAGDRLRITSSASPSLPLTVRPRRKHLQTPMCWLVSCQPDTSKQHLGDRGVN